MKAVNNHFFKSVIQASNFEQAFDLLSKSEITNYSAYIVLAVAISRRHEWLEMPPVIDLIAAAHKSNEKQVELVDALFVIFMFNMINVVANEFGIRPEWNTKGRFLKIRKGMMELALPWLVRMNAIQTDDSIRTNLKEALSDLDIKWNFVWELFSENPRIAVAVQQTMLALSISRTFTLAEKADSASAKSIFQVFSNAVETSVEKFSDIRLLMHFD